MNFRNLFTPAILLMTIGAGCISTSEPIVSEGSTESEDSAVTFSLPVVNPEAREPEEDVQSGPYVHSVWVASSEDGLTFTNDFDVALVEHASVPTVLEFPDGTIRTYFVDASAGPEDLGCIETKDSGQSYSWGSCELAKITSVKAVDFSIVALDDGRYRMYYYASGKVTDTMTTHNVDSAISSDGITFTWEGTVFTYNGLVDPDVFWNGSEWVMHVFSIAENANIVATSKDGTSFTYYGTLSPSGYGVTKPVQLSDGTFRMYGFKQPSSSSFVSFVSDDGLSWTQESGIRFEAPSKTLVTDPFVIQLSDGTYKMYYKQEKDFR